MEQEPATSTGGEPGEEFRPSSVRSPLLWPKLATGLACAILTLAAVLIALPQVLRPHRRAAHQSLAEVLLHPPEGWSAQEVPLASTPDGQVHVARVLQFDDALAVHYVSAAGTNVDIYAAYWRPGKAPYTLVGEHTPDTCWIYNGWQCISRAGNFEGKIAGEKLKPAESGVFTLGGQTVYVIFWHLVGGKPYEDAGLHGWANGLAGHLERLPLLVRDLWHYWPNSAQEQMFVRISSPTPIDELFGQRDVQQLLLALKPFGLAQPAVQPG